jgi:hypothetical protein
LLHTEDVSGLRVWYDSIGCEDGVKHYGTVFTENTSPNVMFVARVKELQTFVTFVMLFE